ncbi:MAG: sulfatase [Planctomycetes bacterium]|nr:sulfatase [Planctomycetota bacterium]
MPRAAKHPDILLVFIDSLRADHASCYGYPRPTTPNLDRIAAEGCRFDACITAAPYSPASYASVVSGLYPHQHGVNGDNVRVWPDSWPRLPELLRRRGYYTFCVSNNDFVSEATNARRGFDDFAGLRPTWFQRQLQRVYHRLNRLVGPGIAGLIDSRRVLAGAKGDSLAAVQQVSEFVARADGRPFFGMLILMDPHALYHPSRTQFVRDRVAARSFLARVNGRQMYAKVMAGAVELSEADRQAAIDFYDAEIAHADRCLGRLCADLRRAGRLDDTLLAVAADHGEAFGEQDVWGHGFCLTDCLTRVPLVLRHPRLFPAGSHSAALVQLHDLHTTALCLSDGIRPCPDEFPYCLTRAADRTWPGRPAAFSEFPVQTGTLALMSNLRAGWHGQAQRRHDDAEVAGTPPVGPAFRPVGGAGWHGQAQRRHEGAEIGSHEGTEARRHEGQRPASDWGWWACPMWSVRTREWRYIEYTGGGRELYDLTNDPGETTSVHEHRPEVCEALARTLDQHRGQSPPPTPTTPAEPSLDAVVLDRLRALGYVE